MPEEAGALHELSLAAIGSSAAEHYSPAELAAWASRRSPDGHRRMLEQTFLLVAEVEDRLAGFANLESGEGTGTVDQLFVTPDSGGRGVGRALLDALADHAESLGMSHLDSHASKRAVGLFERCGYRRLETEYVAIEGEVLERYHVRLLLPRC